MDKPLSRTVLELLDEAGAASIRSLSLALQGTISPTRAARRWDKGIASRTAREGTKSNLTGEKKVLAGIGRMVSGVLSDAKEHGWTTKNIDGLWLLTKEGQNLIRAKCWCGAALTRGLKQKRCDVHGYGGRHIGR